MTKSVTYREEDKLRNPVETGSAVRKQQTSRRQWETQRKRDRQVSPTPFRLTHLLGDCLPRGFWRTSHKPDVKRKAT